MNDVASTVQNTKPKHEGVVATIQWPPWNDGNDLPLRFFSFDTEIVKVDRIDDCRVEVTVKEPIGVLELKTLATLLTLACAFYEAERHLVPPATEVPFSQNPFLLRA